MIVGIYHFMGKWSYLYSSVSLYSTAVLRYYGLTKNAFKGRLYIHKNPFKYESKRTSVELSDARIWSKYLKIPWKFLTLMTSHWHPRSSVREMIIYLRVTSTSIYCCTIRILAAERPEILVIICCYLFLRQERVHINIFFK